MLTTGGCLSMIFLGVTAMTIVVALRSAWHRRFEPPLTPPRIVGMVIVIVAAAVLAVITRNDDLLVPLICGVFVVSVAWLIKKGL